MAIFLLLDYNKMVQFIYQQAQVNIIITTVYIFFKYSYTEPKNVLLPLWLSPLFFEYLCENKLICKTIMFSYLGVYEILKKCPQILWHCPFIVINPSDTAINKELE